MKLEGKVAIVTGGSRGIGRSISLALARSGADVVVNYLVNADAASSVAEEIRGVGRKVLVFQADVADIEQVNDMVRTTVRNFGKIDILVNNAGISSPKWVLDITEEEWNRIIDVNLKGVFNCSKAVLPHMMDQQSGKIVNISSDAAKQGGVTAGVHYCAAKAGVIGLTKSLAKKLAPYHINVNAVAPGSIETDIVRKERTEKQRDALKKSTPFNRFGRPEEVAAGVLFLVTAEAGYITGATLDINGGSYMT